MDPIADDTPPSTVALAGRSTAAGCGCSRTAGAVAGYLMDDVVDGERPPRAGLGAPATRRAGASGHGSSRTSCTAPARRAASGHVDDVRRRPVERAVLRAPGVPPARRRRARARACGRPPGRDRPRPGPLAADGDAPGPVAPASPPTRRRGVSRGNGPTAARRGRALSGTGWSVGVRVLEHDPGLAYPR